MALILRQEVYGGGKICETEGFRDWTERVRKLWMIRLANEQRKTIGTGKVRYQTERQT